VTFFLSLLNLTAEKTIEIEAKNCHGFEVSPMNSTREICCGKESLEIGVTNKGEMKGNYHMGYSGPEYAEIAYGENDTEIMTIEPGESFYQYLEINSPCTGDMKGFDAEITTKSVDAELEDTKLYHFDVVSQEACFMPVVLDNIIKVRLDNVTNRIRVKNTGVKEATYLVEYRGPEWTALSTTYLVLTPGETKDIIIISQPTNETLPGKYRADLVLKTEAGQEYSFELEVELPRGMYRALEGFWNRVNSFLANYFVYIIIAIILIAAIIILSSTLVEKMRRLEKKERVE